jgi:hypothetical protein
MRIPWVYGALLFAMLFQMQSYFVSSFWPLVFC